MDISKLTQKNILSIAFILSLLISIYAIWQDELIQTNAYIFLRTAQFFIDQGVSAAQAVYAQPFYPILIGIVSTYTGLSLEYAAYLINSLSFAALTIFFGKIICELTDDRRVLVVGLILLLAYPKLNESYRTYIIRDPGYWAFYLLAVLSFMRFWKYSKLRDALIWGCSITIATLFRHEGVVFLLCCPPLLFLRTDFSIKEKLYRFIEANLFAIAIIIITIIWLAITDQSNFAFTSQFYKVAVWILDVIPDLFNTFQERADRLSDALFYEYPFSYSKDYALAGVITTTLVIFFTEIVSSLTYIYTAFFLHAIVAKTYPRNTGVTVIAGFVVINIAIILVFLSHYIFLTGRYGIALSLLLLIIASFSVVQLYDAWMVKRLNSRKWNLGGILLFAIFLIGALDGFISTSPSKAYIKQAGYWMKDNLPENAKVFTNISVILYYSGNITQNFRKHMVGINNIESILNSSEANTYVAFKIGEDDEKENLWLDTWKGSLPLNEFANNNGDKVVIYATVKNSQSVMGDN
ncbi:MAG: hypothetical protein GY814_17140 [Gammaproteobacteria bacterium]|nr:hypothetical protein [Gammaproteobacteria bacterium]